MAHLVEALRYRPQGRRFDCHVDTGLTYSFQSQYCSGFYSGFNKDEYQGYIPRRKGSRCLGLSIVILHCADILECLGSLTSCNTRGLCKFAQGLYYLIYRSKAVMDITYMRKEIGHMNSIEGF